MRRHLLFLLVLGALAATAGPARAQTLRQAVEAAWSLNAEIASLTAKRETVIARRRAAAGWFPGPPAITLSHVTDQVIENKRQRATEGEVSVPLWLPGEGTATEQVADADLLRLDAQIAAARLKLAGEVREALYAVALAEAEVTVADRRVQTARALEADVGRREKAGDVASLEGDLSKAESLEAQTRAREKRAELAAARTSFTALTGLRLGKAAIEEPLGPGLLLDAHPRLQASLRAIDAARAALRLATIADRDSPEIGIVGSRNRDIRGAEYDSMVGLRLKIPFSSEGRNAPRRAAAQAELTAAQAEYAAAQRQVEAELSAARQALAATQDQAPLVAARLKALRQAEAKLKRSYEAGEIGLAELLRNRTALYEAEAANAANRLGVLRARGRINQAAGLVP